MPISNPIFLIQSTRARKMEKCNLPVTVFPSERMARIRFQPSQNQGKDLKISVYYPGKNISGEEHYFSFSIPAPAPALRCQEV
jgi:hypothetical protein